jgi:hypothetical protein
MIVVLRMRQREVGEDDENDMEHMSRYEKPVVKLTILVLETSNWCFDLPDLHSYLQ